MTIIRCKNTTCRDQRFGSVVEHSSSAFKALHTKIKKKKRNKRKAK